jgi:RNA polymerase sigma-70 factor (ECF subfamily)
MRKSDVSYTSKFTALHNRLYGKVLAFVRLRISDPEEAKDIVQDVFVKAYNSWQDKVEDMPDESTAKNFLYIMARQRMIDLWRSARHRLQTDLLNKNEEGGDDLWGTGDFDSMSGDTPLPEDVFEKNETRDEVLRLLNCLKQEERELLILRFLEEREYKELAEIYHTSENNIRQRVSRSLQNLKKVVNKNNNI